MNLQHTFRFGLRKIGLVIFSVMNMLFLNNINAQSIMKNKHMYVYVSTYSRTQENNAPFGLNVFKLDPKDGSLSLIQQVKSRNPSWIELAPSQRFLYVCYSLRDEKGSPVGAIEAYKINPQTGKLILLNRLPLGSGPAQMAVSPDEKQLVVANYFFGDYAVFPIKEDGSIEPVASSLQNTGKGIQPRQDAPHPHAVAFDRNGKYIGAADLGIDKVEIFRLVNNILERVSEASVAPGMGARHIAFSIDNKVLYVIGELNGKITAFSYDGKTGKIGKELQTVSTTPDDYSGNQSGAEITVHPSGKFLYASNRSSRTVAGYRIDTSGKLSLINFATEGVENPTSFSIDPNGKWLYVPNNGGKDIVQFSINPGTGELMSTSRKILITAPNVMVFRTSD